MNQAQQLKEKIEKMEKGLSNPNIQGAAREALETSLGKAKAQLAEMEKTKAPSPSKPNKIYKKDFYAAMDKKYPGLTQATVRAMKQNEYEQLQDSLGKHAIEMGVPEKDAVEYADAYLGVHLPKGSTTGKSDTPKTVKKNQPTKPVPPVVSYSWRKKEEVGKLSPVVLHCQHYSLKVEKDISVRLKGNGNESIEVMVKTGEYLIFDDKGYLVFVMNANSFQRKCNKNTSLENQEALKHKAAKTEQLEKEIQKLKAEIAKRPAQSKPQPSAKTPKAKPAKKTPPASKPASKKRHKCTAEELSTAQLLAKVMKFVEQNTMVWNDIFSSKKWKKSQEIEGIYEMKGDNAGKVIVKIRDWSTKAKKDQIKWYKLCIDSFKLTKIEAPGQNTYKRIISKRQLQAAYTTKGEHKYKRCATLYSEMAKCRAKGNCTTEQKERYSKRIGTCGNLGKRKVAVPTFVKYLHVETRKRRKVGESYGEALSRVAGEIKVGG